MSDRGRHDGDVGSINTSKRPQSKLRRRRRRNSRTTSDADNSTRGDRLVVNDPIDDKDQTPTTLNASNVPHDVNLIVQSRRGGHSKHRGDADSSLGDSISTCSSVSRTSSVSSSSATSKLFSFFVLTREPRTTTPGGNPRKKRVERLRGGPNTCQEIHAERSLVSTIR